MRRFRDGGGHGSDFAGIFQNFVFQGAGNPPLEHAPCANAQPEVKWSCRNRGRLACGKCQLVGYCSKECQTKHWRRHKSECNDPVRSETWSPAWVVENRAPNIMKPDGPSRPDVEEVDQGFGLGINLWGKVPAVDLLNLPSNEGNSNQDLSLACISSGDLRNIIRTINELPSDYSGEITVLLNDPEPIVVARNIVFLLTLGRTNDKAQVADHALHFFYSAFISTVHEISVRLAVRPFLDSCFVDGLKVDDDGNHTFSSPLGARSNLSGATPYGVIGCLLRLVNSVCDAAGPWRRMRYAPSRNDHHDFRYSRLEPSHRLAFLKYRTTGLVTPFSTPTEHFKHSNQYVFSEQNEWLGEDLANPLDSWDIGAVIQAGKAHGVQRGDLYGSLYFYLTQQLRTFAERLDLFRINFRIFCTEPRSLAQIVRTDKLASYGFPAGSKFDRIEVSDISGVPDVTMISDTVKDWGPMLKENKHATCIASFTEWHRTSTNASASDEETKSDLISMLIKDGRVPRPKNPASIIEVTRVAGMLVGYSNACTVYYDNSKAFKDFLEAQGLTDDLLRRIGIKAKEKHTIIPHRLCAPLDGPPDALPSFPSKESWYQNVCIGGYQWSERFVELSRL